MSSSLPRPIQSRSTSLRGGIRRREDAAGGDEVAGYLCWARLGCCDACAATPIRYAEFAQALAVIRDVVKAVAARYNGLHRRSAQLGAARISSYSQHGEF